MTGERVGVGHDPSRGAAYVEGWVAALEEDPREIRRAAPRPTPRRSPTSCWPGAASVSPNGSRHRWPPPALPTRSTLYGRSSRFRPGASVRAAEAGEGVHEMFDRTIGSDPRPAAPQSRAIYRMRDGHRREYDASRDRGSTSFRERCRGALADIGIYGAVSYRDLAEAHFGGHPYTTRRAVNAWIREGLAQETRATGPNGNPFKMLTLTRKGVAEARKLAAERGINPGQEIGFARTRPAEAAHDTAIYRACRQEHQRLIEQGATVRRVRLDGEFKSAVARKSESARAKDGRRAADAERHRVAEELGLPIDAQGRVLYPDAQIEYTDSEGRTGRVNIEVASANYRARSIHAKAAAGFRMHANGPAAARLLCSLGVGDGGDRSSLRGPTDRDPAALEL